MGVASAEEETQAVMKVYSKEDYSVVNRFESKMEFTLTGQTNAKACFVSFFPLCSADKDPFPSILPLIH